MNHHPHLNDIFITERLKKRLGEISVSPIISVIAPMGFGKTTAINVFIKRLKKSHAKTVILRQMIVTDSVTDFWYGFCRAFNEFPELNEQIKALGYPKDAPSMSLLSELLYDALKTSPCPIYFIIDDLHLLGKDILTPLILMFSRNFPDCLHLILISRNQIFNEEERMRLGNLHGEISAADLRLNRQELEAYAKRCELNPSSEELDILMLHSEGWISMVYLNFKSYAQNGYWLSSSSDIFELIHQVLLAPLTEKQQEFLTLVCMTDEFTAKQAVFLCQYPDAQQLLNFLSKNNAFITKNENGIYRTHHMLRQCVRQIFSQKEEVYKQKSYSRLGNWYLLQKEYLPAYFAFATANDFQGLLTVLAEDKAKSINFEHSQAFFEWISKCPEQILLQNPVAIVVSMVTMFSFYNIPEIKRLKSLLIKSLEQGSLPLDEQSNILGDAEVAESFLAYNNISAMSAYHRRACSLLSRNTMSIDPKDAWTFAAPSVFMMYHRRAGYADRENTEMKECMPFYYQLSDWHGNGAEHSFSADLFYERGVMTDADISNKMALSAARRKNQYSVMLCSEFLNLRMAIFEADFEKFEKKSYELGEWLRNERQYALLNTFDMCLGFLYGLIGIPDLAPKWFKDGKLSETLVMFPATPMLHTFYNQLLLSKEEWTEVIARQDECKELYKVHNNISCEIWLYIQVSAALEKLGRRTEAVESLKIALEMAIPDDIIMPFAESEIYISELLQELKNTGLYVEEIERISPLAEHFSVSRKSIREKYFGENETYGLSQREFEIAKLAALRKTNQEIATELHLAEGTIRNQLSRIFDKLGLTGDNKNKRTLLEDVLKIKN